jgi:hypothetical protein
MKRLVYVAIIALIAAAAMIIVRAGATIANSNPSYPVSNRGGLFQPRGLPPSGGSSPSAAPLVIRPARGQLPDSG